jgi:hypothetical protein
MDVGLLLNAWKESNDKLNIQTSSFFYNQYNLLHNQWRYLVWPRALFRVQSQHTLFQCSIVSSTRWISKTTVEEFSTPSFTTKSFCKSRLRYTTLKCWTNKFSISWQMNNRWNFASNSKRNNEG